MYVCLRGDSLANGALTNIGKPWAHSKKPMANKSNCWDLRFHPFLREKRLKRKVKEREEKEIEGTERKSNRF
jgi:hypothetical protein